MARFQIYGGPLEFDKNQPYLQYFYVAQEVIEIITKYQLLGDKTMHTSIIGYNVLDFSV